MNRRYAMAAASLALVALAAVSTPATAAVGSAALSGAAPSAAIATASAGPSERAAELVGQMTTAEQAASIVMGHVSSTDPEELRGYMQGGLGGFILMGGNIPGTEEELETLTSALTIDPALPPLIAVDQEGGIVSRLHGDDYPAATTLKDLPVSATASAFAARGSLVARAGITVNFGTVADVTSDPGSFIYGRALGTSPAGAAERVSAATTAQEQFLASTLKHFPGHGAAPGDSHHTIPATGMSLQEWRAADAVPFIAGIDAGASMLMFGHLAYTAIDPAPASMSAKWHELAREELGFDGVSVTDDLGMLTSSGVPAYADPIANAVGAVAAGNDLVLMIAGSTRETASQMASAIAAAVDTGTLPPERLEDAATRVLALRLQLSSATSAWTVCSDCTPAE